MLIQTLWILIIALVMTTGAALHLPHGEKRGGKVGNAIASGTLAVVVTLYQLSSLPRLDTGELIAKALLILIAATLVGTIAGLMLRKWQEHRREEKFWKNYASSKGKR